jgi:3-phenylpropionate/trans-cinnamate dioxygenase ferredoxin reductase component
MTDIVIIGGGHAAAQLCGALAAAGQGRRLHLVCEEPALPYHRPPLSKSFLKNAEEPLQWHRAEAWFAEQGITLHRGDAALAFDRAARRVTLASGRVLSYEWLVLATGTRARRLAHLPDGLANVQVLRTAADAERLRAAWGGMQRLTVLGGGFIGLEVAATARALGKEVQVLESAPRLMMRSVSPEISAHVEAVHRASGMDLRTGIPVGGFEIEGDRLTALEAGGERLAVDTLLLGIGAVPEHTLASAAGLACDNGVVVDEHMRTSDPSVLAIGDCTSFPEPTTGRRLRLESVQNANDQAKAAAATILGTSQPYRALPWFWSEQGSMRLQMAGIMPVEGERFRRPGAVPASFSILHYAAGRLACVESVNAPLDHMAARKLLESGRSPDPAAAADPGIPLKEQVTARSL